MVAENDFYPPFSKEEYERRYQKIREFMEKDGLDCLIVYGTYAWMGTDQGQINTVYLSNYAGFVQTYVVFPLKDDPTLFISFDQHIDNARNLSVIKDVRCSGFEVAEGIGERLKELSLEKAAIGIVGPLAAQFRISIPVEHHQYLTTTFSQAKFKVVTKEFEDLRLIKSDEEIKYMEKAAAMTDLAQEEIVLATKPGVRHSDLHQIAFSVAGRCGGKVAIDHVLSIPMSNPQRCYPDPYPTHRTVESGDVVMTELCVGYGGYFGKIHATYFVGEPNKVYQEQFELAASVHNRVLAELKPGSTGRDVSKFLAPIKEAGYTSRSLVSGWSTYNHQPSGGSDAALDFVFKPGHCIQTNAHPVTPDKKRGVWVGTSCVFAEDRLRSFQAYPANKMRVV